MLAAEVCKVHKLFYSGLLLSEVMVLILLSELLKCVLRADIGVGPLQLSVGEVNSVCKLGKVILLWTVAFYLRNWSSLSLLLDLCPKERFW